MKVLLINPPVRVWSKPNCFPLGLAYLASTLQKEDVAVLDINALRLSRARVEEIIKEIDVDVVGIGGIITTFEYVQWLCETIKIYHPNTYVVVGGAVATSIPEILLNNTLADILVLGEGELTFFNLCMAIKYGCSFLEIPGLAYRNPGIIKTPSQKPLDLSKLPIPPWSLFPMETYLKNPIGYANSRKWVDGQGDGTLTMNMSATRGCPYNCVYCAKDFSKYKYRVRPPEKVFAEMKELFERYGVEYIHFIDDEFSASRKFVFELCNLLIKSGLSNAIQWGGTGRVNLADEEMYRLMKSAGCVQVAYGIESGSQAMLDVMRKGVTVEQAKNAIRLVRNVFGNYDVSFIVGMIGENDQTVQESINFCKDTGIKPNAVFFLTAYPMTQLWEMVKEKGLIKDELQYIKSLGEQGDNIVINFTDYPDEKLREWKHSLMEA